MQASSGKATGGQPGSGLSGQQQGLLEYSSRAESGVAVTWKGTLHIER